MAHGNPWGDQPHTVTLPHALFGQGDATQYQAIYASTTAPAGTVTHYIAAHITERVRLYRERLGAFGLDVTPLLEQSLWAMAAADLGAIFRSKSGDAGFASYDSNGALKRTATNNLGDAASLIASIDGPSRFFSFLQLWQSIPDTLRTEEMQRAVLQFSCGTLRIESWLTMQRQAEFAGSRLLPWIEQDALGLVGAIPAGDMPDIPALKREAEAGGGTSGHGDEEAKAVPASVPPARSTAEYDAYQERVYTLMEQVRNYLSEKLRGCAASTPTQAAYLAQGITLLSHAARRLAAVGSMEVADLIATCDTLVAKLPTVTGEDVRYIQRPFPPGTFLNTFLTSVPASAPASADVIIDVEGAASAPGAVISRQHSSGLNPDQVPTMLVDRLAVATTRTAVNQPLLQSYMMHDPAQLPAIQPFLTPKDSIDADIKEAFRNFTLPGVGARSVFLQDLYEANSHVPFGLIEVTVRLVNHLKSELGKEQFAGLYDALGANPHDRWARFVDLVLSAIPNDIWTDGLVSHKEILRALWMKISAGDPADNPQANAVWLSCEQIQASQRELMTHLCGPLVVAALRNPTVLAETKDADDESAVGAPQQTQVTSGWLDYFVWIDLATGAMQTKVGIDWEGFAKACVCLSDAWITDVLPQLAIKLRTDSAQRYASRAFAETALTNFDDVLFFLQDGNGHYPVPAKPACRIATAHKIFEMQAQGLITRQHYHQNEGGKKAMPNSAQAWRLIESLGMRFLQNLGRSHVYKRRAKQAAWASVGGVACLAGVICWAEYGKNSKWGSMSKYNALVLLFTELLGVGIAAARSAVMALSDLGLPGFHFDKVIQEACKMEGIAVPTSCYGWKTNLGLTLLSGAGQYVLVQSMRKDAPYKHWLSGVKSKSLHFWGATAITYLGGAVPSLFTGLLLWGIARELTTVVTGVVHTAPSKPISRRLQAGEYASLPDRAPVPPGVSGFILVLDDHAAPPIGVVMTRRGGSPELGASPSVAIPIGDVRMSGSRATSVDGSFLASSLDTTRDW